MLTKLSNPPTSMISRVARLRWTWSREAEEAAGESRPDQGMERERAFE